MKKKIEADLISIAHRILQLKDHTTLSQLQEETRLLYEKLTILNFSETHFAGPQPTIGQVRAVLEKEPETTLSPESITPSSKKNDTKLPEASEVKKETDISYQKQPSVSETIKKQIKTTEHTTPQTTEELTKKELNISITKKTSEQPIGATDEKPEFVIDEINAAISEDLFVPATADEINAILRGETIVKSPIAEPKYQKNDIANVTPEATPEPDRPKSLNDKLKININIGLNDRLAFIKHLFEGSSADYNRVLSQLNTLDTATEALDFVQTHIKPDHKNWENKEEYEQRFLQIVSAKFD